MKTPIPKAALGSGLMVFLIIIVLLLSRAGSMILLALVVLPGLVYGFALLVSANHPVSAIRSVFFMLFSLTINVTCVCFVSNGFLRSDHYVVVELITCSTISAVLLNICYCLFLSRHFSLFHTLAMPAILGIAASLISAICTNLLVFNSYNEFVSTVLYVGVFTIFPLWQYLMGLNLFYHNRVISPTAISVLEGEGE